MNPILLTDSYKVTHWPMYPPGTTKVYSYLEARTGGRFPATVFFGLQYILMKYLQGVKVLNSDVDEAKDFFSAHYGSDKLFNEAGWRHIVKKHGGKLPLLIKAVPEGTVVPVSNVLMTVENTDPEVPWLTNYMESLLVQVWYPTTVATLSWFTKQVIREYLLKTGDPQLLPFKLHDFGFRSVSSVESAILGGMAHLVNFLGTDTLPPLWGAKRYYNEPMAGHSIAASEHSTITSWGKQGEAYQNILNTYPSDSIIACVIDSYDDTNAVANLFGGFLKAQVMGRSGTLVLRPDSSNPQETVGRILHIMGEKLGYAVNNKGYRVLSPQVRLIQGDGVNYDSILGILQHITANGWSTDNVAFGMGGGLLQQVNRDTQRFAFKCSSIMQHDLEVDVFKEPKSDPGKNSKRGRLGLAKLAGPTVEYRTYQLKPDTVQFEDVLRPVFKNGELLVQDDFATIRGRAAS